MNLITYRRPSYLCWSDACPEGIVGFDHTGWAWRLKIPEKYQVFIKNKNNCLEFIASIITKWQAIIQGRTTEEECFLSLGDNSSSVGWLHKASVDDSKNLPLFIASRKFADIMVSSNTCVYSQHIPGISNTIADALSRRFDLSDENLTSFLNSFPDSQVQSSYKLCPVHPDICSWMTYWLQKCSAMKELQKIQKTKRLECGDNGWSTQNLSDFHMMCGCQACSENIRLTSLEPSQPPSGEENFLSRTKKAWLLQQSKRPWQNRVRSLGQTWGTTPHMEWDLKHCTRYLPDNSRGCKT